MSRQKPPAPPAKKTGAEGALVEAPAARPELGVIDGGLLPPQPGDRPLEAAPVAAAAPSEEELAELRELPDEMLLSHIDACEEAAEAGGQEAALALPYLKAELERRTASPRGADDAGANEAPPTEPPGAEPLLTPGTAPSPHDPLRCVVWPHGSFIQNGVTHGPGSVVIERRSEVELLRGVLIPQE